MPPPKKDGMSSGGRTDSRAQNGARSNFRTDQAISNGRFGNQRELKPWISDSNEAIDGSLEKSSSSGAWDQFAENERLFGLKTDYDENIYTTVIDKSHPQYRQRILAAERTAKEIERSAPTTAHVAEERVMDYVGGKDQGEENEEDKYSGVRRQGQDFPPLGSSRENKYTPPAKRAPTGQSTVKGAPVDPAIIDAQIRAPPKKQTPAVPEPSKTQTPTPIKNGVATNSENPPKEAKAADDKTAEAKPINPASEPKSSNAKTSEASETPVKPAGAVNRNASPGSPSAAPSATSTVERDVLNSFKTFAIQQRANAEKARTTKAKADKEVRLTELKKFASTFKLSTPVPNDLVSIIAKDPAKQKEIQAKAMKNAEEIAKSKVDVVKEKPSPPKETQSKSTEQTPAAPATEPRPPRATPQSTPPSGPPGRNPGPRQPYNQQQYHNQAYRNNRGGPQQQQTGNLGQRLRNLEHQKFSQPAAAGKHAGGAEMRPPPTGPANDVDYNRRYSAVPSHMGPPKLNPNSHEFRPSAFAAPFNPNGHISTSSSPRSTANNVPDAAAPTAPSGQLIRRKTKAVDATKCCILTHVKSITPPSGRKWDDNGGLRPSYDTPPTWRQLQDDEKPDSTMHLTCKEYFDRQPFSSQSMATPNPSHVVPQMAHQHQLPFHLQQGAHNMGQRQSPHMPPMQMHTPQHLSHPPPYGNDDHRMMHSNSAQSFASPRLGHVPVYNSPAQAPYNQPVFMGPGAPQMGQFRSFSNTPQYMPPQQGQMGGPMMMQPQFMPGPQAMVAAPQMYPGAHPGFMPPTGPPQPAANGYHSPGRPAAPMMAHQGSQQGQPLYGMSPNVQYSQPAYGPGQHAGPLNNARGYNGPGPQHFGTSPSQAPQYGPQQRTGSNSYSNNPNKNFPSGPAQHQGTHANHASPATSQSRPNDGSDEAK